ncbi:hypothetical protein HPB50_023371 [Hyalomma asiaticum]|uniref:Uncharacterized protein n=1 Tax=Hyalomma asiaticum TaxID=266040 RepID=A0ACB7TSC9_HYAAI|nr:hypothetical protein HPB50_023371 [Hyalomma asiaticum]
MCVRTLTYQERERKSSSVKKTFAIGEDIGARKLRAASTRLGRESPGEHERRCFIREKGTHAFAVRRLQEHVSGSKEDEAIGHASRERYDALASRRHRLLQGARQCAAKSDASASTEYLTQAGSPLSLDFSTFDTFPWEKEEGDAEPMLPPHLAQTSTYRINDHSPPAVATGEEDPVAQIVDVSGQRVDFRTTPSTVLLLSGSSSTKSAQRGYFVVQGYQSLSNSDSSSDRYSNTATSGSSCVRSTSARPSPPRAPVRVVDPSALSTSKLLERCSRTHWNRASNSDCGRRGFACGLDCSGAWPSSNVSPQHGRTTSPSRARWSSLTRHSRRLCRTDQPASFLRDADGVFNNASSDEFYTAGTLWGGRGGGRPQDLPAVRLLPARFLVLVRPVGSPVVPSR